MADVVTKNTLLKVQIASVWTTIAQLEQIDGPEAEVQDTDATTLDTNGAGMESAFTGFVNPGELTGTLKFDPALAIHKVLTGDLVVPAKRNYKLVFSNSVEWPFLGFLKKLGPSAQVAQLLKANFSVKLSGLVSYPS